LDILTGKELFYQKYPFGNIVSVGFHPNDVYIYSGLFDGKFIIWDTATGNQLFTNDRIGRSSSIIIYPKGNRLLVRSTLILIPGNNIIHDFRPYGAHALSEDGKYILEFRGSNTVYVRKYDVNTFKVVGEDVKVLTEREGRAFSPKSNYVIVRKPRESSGEALNSPKLVDTKTGALITTLQPPVGEEETTTPYDYIVMSADESTVAASRGKEVYVWDIRSLKEGIQTPKLYKE